MLDRARCEIASRTAICCNHCDPVSRPVASPNNDPAQARQANDVRLPTETRSRRCQQPVCSASQVFQGPRPILQHRQQKKTWYSEETSYTPRGASTFCLCVISEARHRPDRPGNQQNDAKSSERGSFFLHNNPRELSDDSRNEEEKAQVVVSLDHQMVPNFVCRLARRPGRKDAFARRTW